MTDCLTAAHRTNHKKFRILGQLYNYFVNSMYQRFYLELFNRKDCFGYSIERRHQAYAGHIKELELTLRLKWSI